MKQSLVFFVFYTLTQSCTWDPNRSLAGDICFFKQNKMKNSLKPEGQMLRWVMYRLVEPLASMGHSSIWKLICAISVCNTLTVGVHLSSTPSISSPGSATEGSLTLAMGKCLRFSVKIKVCQSSLYSPWSYPDLSTLWLWNPFSILNASKM